MINRKNRFLEGRRRRRRFSRILFYVIALVFLGELVYLVFFSPFTLIAEIAVSGNAQIDRQSILDSINSELSGKFFNLLNKNNLALIRSGKLEKLLLARFKQIKTVEIGKKFPSTLEVNINERQTAMAVKSRESCFLLDENGEAFDAIGCDSNRLKNSDLILFQDESGKDINFGSIVLEPDLMAYVSEIKNRLGNEMNLDLENNFLTPNIISSDIRAKTREGWSVYFNGEINLDKEMEMLNVFLANKIEDNQRPDLEYVDLRIDNKIYYKFKQGFQEEMDKQEEPDDKSDTVKNEGDKKKKKA